MRRLRRRRRRHYGKRRGFAFNGSSLVAAAKSNINTDRVMQAAAFLGGGAANEAATQFLARLIPLNFVKAGPGQLLLGVITSGAVVGLGAKKFAPKYAAAASLGALADVLMKGMYMYFPGIASRIAGGGAPAPVATTKGYMGDYLTPGDVARARSLGDMGDYLTPGDVARARSLGGMGYSDEMQDSHVADELAAM